MIPGFVIVFRETLEAALIVGIVFSYLDRLNARDKFKQVWAGIGFGILASILSAVLFQVIAGGFSGQAEKIFEGVTFLIGAVLLTTFILWMIKEEKYVTNLQKKVETRVNSNQMLGIFLIVFISILREGIETVIFFQSLTKLQNNAVLNWFGAIIGAGLAVLAGILIYKGEKRFSLKKFFFVTNIILIMFAGGMVAYGIHELQEAGVVPVVVEHLYNINPPVIIEGIYPVLHDKGAIGSIFKGLFGYNGNPSLIELICYWMYLSAVVAIWRFWK